jgi:hypothetical protein
MTLHMPTLTSDLCREVVTASLAHLARPVDKDGHFAYAHPAGDPGTVHHGYNILHHCGTLWFMARAVNELPVAANPDLLQALVRATSLIGRKLAPPSWAPPSWAAPDRPSLALVSAGEVKLGGLALALLTLGEVQKIAALQPLVSAVLPHSLPETLTRLRQCALDDINGDDFHHKRDFATGAVMPFRSDYYSGEAIFGLMMTGPMTEDLARVTSGLMLRGYGWAEQSHWMAYAACEAVERGMVTEALGSAYLGGLMQVIMTNTGYRDRRQSTPIACRTEALTRVLLLARARPGFLDAGLVDRIRAHAEANLLLQQDWYADGQFWHGDDSNRVQIDYIQHNALGYLQWLRFVETA